MGQRGSAPGRARFLAGRAGGRFAHPLASRLPARIVKGVEMARESSLELLVLTGTTKDTNAVLHLTC
jgi:hypothetical protein